MNASVLPWRVNTASFEKRNDVMELPFGRPVTSIENPTGNNSDRQAKSGSKPTQEQSTKAIRASGLVHPQLAQNFFDKSGPDTEVGGHASRDREKEMLMAFGGRHALVNPSFDKRIAFEVADLHQVMDLSFKGGAKQA